MSDAVRQLESHHDARIRPAATARPTWWVVFLNEAHGLWVGGKAPVLLLLFSIVLGVHAFVTAYNVELSLMPPKEMVYETAKTAISVGIFMAMIIAADAISGDRERGTLEAVLLTPSRRRQIVAGKFLAALTPWPAAYLLTIPYMAVLSQGDDVLWPAVAWGALLGSVLTLAYAGTGLLVSFWSNTNRTSYLVSLGIYILILVPAQLPGRAQTGAAGQFLQQLNPLAAVNHFLSKTLVNNNPVEEWATWLISPGAFAILVLFLLFAYSAPGLRLEAGRAGRIGQAWRRVAARVGIGLSLLGIGALAGAGPVVAAAGTAPRSGPSHLAAGPSPVDISVDLEYVTVNTGDPVFFDTVVTNPTAEPSAPLIVAMNIINLDQEGDVVDPEDWSPERTQYIDRLAPGQAATLSWRVNSILDGDYIVYMVVMPEPAERDATSQAVASTGVHLTVMPFTRLNPRGVLPLVIGAPVVLAFGTALALGIRRRETELGGVTGGIVRLAVVAGAVVVALGALSAFAIASQGSAAPIANPAPGGSARPGSEGDNVVLLDVDTAAEPEDFTFADSTLNAPADSTITLTLHNRTDADDEIGHNWVLVQPGQEESVLANGIAAGDDRDWLDENDPGIIAHTALIEGATSDSVTFDAPQPGIYTFLCTFPDHYAGGGFGTLTIEGGE